MGGSGHLRVVVRFIICCCLVNKKPLCPIILIYVFMKSILINVQCFFVEDDLYIVKTIRIFYDK